MAKCVYPDQTAPDADCSWWSSLIWVCTVCICHFVRHFGYEILGHLPYSVLWNPTGMWPEKSKQVAIFKNLIRAVCHAIMNVCGLVPMEPNFNLRYESGPEKWLRTDLCKNHIDLHILMNILQEIGPMEAKMGATPITWQVLIFKQEIRGKRCCTCGD